MRAAVGGCPRQPESPSDPTLGRAGTRVEPALLLSCPLRLRGPVLGRERGEGRRGDWGNFPASLARSINHRSRGGGRVGKCAEPERSVVAPDTSLSPHRFLSFSFFFFLNLLLSLLARVAAPAQQPGRRSASTGCRRPPALAASASLSGDSGEGELGGSLLARRLSGARPARPGAGAAAPRDARRTAGAAPARGSRRQLGRPPPLPPAARAR